MLCAQAGWVGSLCGVRARGEGDDEHPKGNKDHTVKMEQFEDTDTSSSPPPGSPREFTRPSQRPAPFPAHSPSRSAHKKILSTGMHGSTKSSRISSSNEGNVNDMPSRSTSSRGNSRGKRLRRAISIPAYSLTCAESFDLLCLALGLLLNWTSGGEIVVGREAASKGMGRIRELPLVH